jgi:hypothetical protein
VGVGDEQRQPADQWRVVGVGDARRRQLGAGALVAGDELVDLVGRRRPQPPGLLGEGLQARPPALVGGDERVDVDDVKVVGV